MPCPLYGQPGPNNNHNQDQPVELIPADRIAAMEAEPEFNFMDDSLTRVEEALGIFVDRADRRAHTYHFNTIPAIVLLERSENPEYWGNIMMNSSLFCSKLADKMIEEDGYVPAWITRAINSDEDSRLAFAVNFEDPGVNNVVSRVQLLQHILHWFHRRGDRGWLDFSNKIGEYWNGGDRERFVSVIQEVIREETVTTLDDLVRRGNERARRRMPRGLGGLR